MAISSVPRTPSQLRLFARPQGKPHWTDLSSDVQRKIVRLMAELLRQYRGTAANVEIAEEEAHGE
jgi:hypothetical protein